MYSRVYFDDENYSWTVDTKSALNLDVRSALPLLVGHCPVYMTREGEAPPDGPKYGDRFVVHPLKVSTDEEAWTIAKRFSACHRDAGSKGPSCRSAVRN